MILALRTDSPVAELYIYDDKGREIKKDVWEAGRSLAKDLLAHLDKLVGSWDKLRGIVVFRGPGSFTGLRIGITTANTISYANTVPIVGVSGDTWIVDGLARLASGDTDPMVLPEYGADPHITAPKK